MARKVFISILGTGYYQKTKYYYNDKDNYIETHFVQEATLNLVNTKWNRGDKAFIFLTKRARVDNWESPAQVNNFFVKKGDSKAYIGLKETLLRNDFLLEIVDDDSINIPDGNNEKEIWEIFEKVFNVLKDNDEVYFDITHAFRSIPMLVMVLINYSKFLKNITVKSITYGNWEGKDENNNSPIINLTAFSELQDWTSAANDFVNFGNVEKLSKLAKNDISPLARQFKGENDTVNSLIKISKFLPQFIDNILTCRGKSITKNMEGKLINKELNNIKENLISPLTPILNKIENKLFPFDNNDNLINGFNAVSWCIDNNLIQQGFTILQENIISLVCEDVDIDKADKKTRNIVSSCFTIKENEITKEEWKGDANSYPEITELILEKSKIIEILKSDYISLTNIRNDINHFGYSDNTMKPEKLKKALFDYHCKILKKLKLII